MKIYVLSYDGDQMYFGTKALLLSFIKVAFRVTYDDINEGIAATAWGSPFWIKEKMLVV